MPPYQSLNSFAFGASGVGIASPSLVPTLFGKPMPIFNVESTGADVVQAFPEKVKYKTCMQTSSTLMQGITTCIDIFVFSQLSSPAAVNILLVVK
jgi:hypothetical protein